MNLLELTKYFDHPRVSGPVEGTITSITNDSRQAGPGVLFFALRGQKVDGHDFIPQALANGASGIVGELDVPESHRGAWVQVKDSHLAYGRAAAALAGHPAEKLKLVGVTGTNGKSTIALLLKHLMGGKRVGLIGTIQYDVGDGQPRPATRTTPDAVELQGLLAEMQENGCAGAAMEVSGHALHQHRVAGVEFDCAISTNLTQDHLDYHVTMEAYYQAKAQFPQMLLQQTTKKKPCLVVNYDDPYGKKMFEDFREKLKVVTYGSGYGSDYRFTDIAMTIQGTQFTLEHKGRQFLVKIPLLGRFNIYNVLAVVAAMHGMGYNLRETISQLGDLPQVPGRMEIVGKQKNFRVLVDYAHTPDALENALRTLKGLQPRRIITVFGCGGGRDRGKRPAMGRVARASNVIITTSDNPREEDPEQILQDIATGLTGKVPARAIVDREEAIETAIAASRDGDIILIAGKGHEKEQVFADRKVPFDDVRIAVKYLKRLKEQQIEKENENA